MIRTLKKYYLTIAALLSSVGFIFYYLHVFSVNYGAPVDTFSSNFQELVSRLDKTLEIKADKVANYGVSEEWEHAGESGDVNLHVYRNDTLVYWSTNQLPILRFANIHFPADGVIRLQNGWYYAKTVSRANYTLCASFLIRQEYPYRNSMLVNGFPKSLSLPYEASVSLNPEHGFPVKTMDGNYIFSIVPDGTQTVSETESVLLLMLFFGSIALWLVVLFQVRKQLPRRWSWIVPAGLVILHVIALFGDWFGFMGGTAAFDPSLYGTSHWLPNFFEFLLNVAIMVFVLKDISLRLGRPVPRIWYKWLLLALYSGVFLFWLFFLYLTEGVIENSSIPLMIDKLFSLNMFSLMAVAGLGALFYALYGFIIAVLTACRNAGFSGAQLAVLTFFLGFLLFLYEITAGNQLFLASLFPLVFNEILLYLVYRQSRSHQLSLGILLLMLFAVVMASTIETFGGRKEHGERELYANQLAMEKNIVTEVEYKALAPKIKEDPFLNRFLDAPHPINISDFEAGMENRLFNGFWERYEMKFYLFNEAHTSLLDGTKTDTEAYDELQDVVEHSGIISEIDPHIFLIHDHARFYSYVIRQELFGQDSARAILFCTLKSKKIPEEIGFPRLLISEESNVLEPLESYSIAKYHEGKLLTRYGSFNYPSSASVLTPSIHEGRGFFDYRGYNHYILNGEHGDQLVLSVRNNTLVDLVTSFSYLFSFYGLLMMPLLFRLSSGKTSGGGMSLSMKIQIGLISLVFLSLLTFGWGSGLFVSTQYNQFTNDMIREKLSSVEAEVSSKLGQFKALDINENGNYMQSILQRFARVFFTDINLYDEHGYLLATSRPKVFNVGLLSEQMNPEAYKYLARYRQSEFVHQESIGALNYSSAYKPFYNTRGVQLGIINLQHFGQQREFENQIQRFLVAIINVFILLLAVSVIMAIFISNWLTSPLRILQESFAKVKFGKFNEHIHYDRNDEIGSLVKDYNQKLDELEFAAQQLAKNEREMAWREMARQVAHEIKNPLTPMKLSVQQLLRVYDPNDPKSAEKLKSVANSIVEQIDALTRIANEFSSFAKMPNLKEERVELLALIRGVQEVFEGQCDVRVETSESEIYLMADRDQFVRVFNNLIKNAIQAIPKERDGVIRIVLRVQNQTVSVDIIDNGTGIPEDLHSKIFVPYFTTKGTGTGLGLAMVKQIIESHHGSIDFDSVDGEGTTFHIVLPLG